MSTLIDWSTLETKRSLYQGLYACETKSIALAYILLQYQLLLTPDEIHDAITDGGLDRGIDAAFVDDREAHPVVHLFQFKCVETFDKSANNFPGNEVDKLLSFVAEVLQRDATMKQSCNYLLWAKIQEIWAAFDRGTPSFVVHLCGNLGPLAEHELTRLQRNLAPYRHFSVQQHTLDSLVSLIIQKARPQLDRQIRVVDKQYFERVDGNIRGFIATVEATELLSMITDPDDPTQVLPAIFDDNVRVYLSSTNRINRMIIDSAVSERNAEFWYLNNGITITCDSLEYSPGVRAPLLSMKNVQIVNGGQTSNALFEASRMDEDKIKNVLVLVRIYETRRPEISHKIAESTNSQTPIRSRDLRSNDDIQKKLEEEFADLGYFYERKAGQHDDKDRARVVDALATGQAYLAYVLDMPETAKKERGRVFGDLYEVVFNENITAAKLLVPLRVFAPIDSRKREIQAAMRRGDDSIDLRLLFLNDGAYHVLNAVSFLVRSQALDEQNVDMALPLVGEAIDIVREAVDAEAERDPTFSYNKFFKESYTKGLVQYATRLRLRNRPQSS